MDNATKFFLRQRGIPTPTKKVLSKHTKAEVRKRIPGKKTRTVTKTVKPDKPETETKEEILTETTQQYENIIPTSTYLMGEKQYPVPGNIAKVIMGKQLSDTKAYMSTFEKGQEFTRTDTGEIKPYWKDESQAISWGQRNLRFDDPDTKKVESMTFDKFQEKQPGYYLGYSHGKFSLDYDPERWTEEQDKKHAWYDIGYQGSKLFGFLSGQTERFYEQVTGHEQTPDQFTKEYKDPFGYNLKRTRYLRSHFTVDITKTVRQGDVLGVVGKTFTQTPVGLVGTYGMGYGLGAFKGSTVGATKVFSIGKAGITLSGVVTASITAPFIASTATSLYKSGFDPRVTSRMGARIPIYGSVFQSGYSAGLGKGYVLDRSFGKISQKSMTFKQNLGMGISKIRAKIPDALRIQPKWQNYVMRNYYKPKGFTFKEQFYGGISKGKYIFGKATPRFLKISPRIDLQ